MTHPYAFVAAALLVVVNAEFINSMTRGTGYAPEIGRVKFEGDQVAIADQYAYILIALIITGAALFAFRLRMLSRFFVSAAAALAVLLYSNTTQYLLDAYSRTDWHPHLKVYFDVAGGSAVRYFSLGIAAGLILFATSDVFSEHDHVMPDARPRSAAALLVVLTVLWSAVTVELNVPDALEVPTPTLTLGGLSVVSFTVPTGVLLGLAPFARLHRVSDACMELTLLVGGVGWTSLEEVHLDRIRANPRVISDGTIRTGLPLDENFEQVVDGVQDVYLAVLFMVAVLWVMIRLHQWLRTRDGAADAEQLTCTLMSAKGERGRRFCDQELRQFGDTLIPLEEVERASGGAAGGVDVTIHADGTARPGRRLTAWRRGRSGRRTILSWVAGAPRTRNRVGGNRNA